MYKPKIPNNKKFSGSFIFEFLTFQLYANIIKRILFIFFIFTALTAKINAQDCYPSPNPLTYILKKCDIGVAIFQVAYLTNDKTYIEVIDFSKGADIFFIQGEISGNEKIGNQLIFGPNPQFEKLELSEMWSKFQNDYSQFNINKYFSICNGVEFSSWRCNSPLVLPMQINGKLITGGNETYTDLTKLRILEKISASNFKFSDFTTSFIPNNSSSSFIISKKPIDDNPTGYDGRTFLSFINNNKIIIIVSDKLSRVEAEKIFGDFDASIDYMTLDGSKSSKLYGQLPNNTIGTYLDPDDIPAAIICPSLNKKRKIPQGIGVVTGTNFNLLLTTPISISPSTINQCTTASISANIKNSGPDNWQGKFYISLHKANNEFIKDLLVTSNITVLSGNNTTISVNIPFSTISAIYANNVYKIYIKYRTNGFSYFNEYPLIYKGNGENPTLLPINYSAFCDQATIPPGNYKKIEMYGLKINTTTNDLEFMFRGYPAKSGDKVIDVEEEANLLKKIFKTAIITPYYKQYITIDPLPLYYTQSWGNVVKPYAPAPFRNTDMANRMFMADLYLKEFWDANFRVNEMNYWKTLVDQSPYKSALLQKGFNNYAFFPCRAAIIPGPVTVNSTSKSVQINSALLNVESSNFHTPYILPWDMNLSLLTQPEKNDLNTRLNQFDNWTTTALSNREPSFRNLLNNDPVFDVIRQIYTTIALAKKYKEWNYQNKPLQNLFDKEDMTGLFDYSLTDQTIVNLWNQSYSLVPEFSKTVNFTDLLGAPGHLTYGGCVMGWVNPIDSGTFKGDQIARDTIVFNNIDWISQDSTVYFYGGVLDYPLADLSGIIQQQKNNFILGDSIKLDATIFNFGNIKAEQFQVRLYEQYINTNNQVQNVLISQKTISILDSFSRQTLTFNWLPITYGSKKLLLTIDEGNQVIERKETNNNYIDSLSILNNIPTLKIISPGNGTAIGNKNIVLSGIAFDLKDGYLKDSNLSWTSNLDGLLGYGNYVIIDSLSIGNHTITFKGENSKGKSAFAYINLYVFPQGFPVVTFKSPFEGDTLPNNASILFSGDAFDINDGSLCDNVTWTSSLDGNIGLECSNNKKLSIGNHRITFSAQNTSGKVSKAVRNIVVINGLPHVSIISPVSNSNFYQHQPLSLKAMATDFPQGNISNTVHWYSNLQGYLGTGQSVSVYLVPGNHTITASVQDNAGSMDVATVFPIFIKCTPPVPSIILSVLNQKYNYRDNITFIGHATDVQDGNLHGNNLKWYSSVNGFIGFGDTLHLNNLTYGKHRILLKATDNDGIDSTIAINQIIIDAGEPLVSITLPFNSAKYFYKNRITFKGNAIDPQDGKLISSKLIWSSDLDGLLGTGDSIYLNTLSYGNQTITLSATDHDGFTGSTKVTFFIEPPHSPSISIYYPFVNNHFIHGSLITFKANAFDYEEGDLGNNRISWSSSITGNLGTGKTISVNTLTPGTHIISATAKDTTGLTTTFTIQIIIDQQNPVATIVSPGSGSIFGQGTNLTFSGTGNDYEDGVLTGSSLQWKSSINGVLGTGQTINTSSLNFGSHLITLIVFDSKGSKDSTNITIIVQAPKSVLLTKFSNGSDSISLPFSDNRHDTIIYATIPKAATVLSAQAKITGRSDLIASVSITATPSGTVTCSTTIVFNAVPINGGDSPYYQWKVNGVNVGTNNSIFSSNSIKNGDKVIVIMSSNLPDISENTVISNAIIINCTP